MEGSPKFAGIADAARRRLRRVRAQPRAARRSTSTTPDEIGDAWERAFAADRPTVLDIRCDPDVPPIPPHATFEQAKSAGHSRCLTATRTRGDSSSRASSRRCSSTCPGRRTSDRWIDRRVPATGRDGDSADVRTGRFERTLSALTAAGAAGHRRRRSTLSHDRRSFGNKMMWWPIVVVPTAIPAGIAAVLLPPRRQDGAAGGAPRSCRQRPAGHVPALRAASRSGRAAGSPPTTWRWDRRCSRPCWPSLVGGMGLLASVLRRERHDRRRDGD